MRTALGPKFTELRSPSLAADAQPFAASYSVFDRVSPSCPLQDAMFEAARSGLAEFRARSLVVDPFDLLNPGPSSDGSLPKLFAPLGTRVGDSEFFLVSPEGNSVHGDISFQHLIEVGALPWLARVDKPGNDPLQYLRELLASCTRLHLNNIAQIVQVPSEGNAIEVNERLNFERIEHLRRTAQDRGGSLVVQSMAPAASRFAVGNVNSAIPYFTLPTMAPYLGEFLSHSGQSTVITSQDMVSMSTLSSIRDFLDASRNASIGRIVLSQSLGSSESRNLLSPANGFESDDFSETLRASLQNFVTQFPGHAIALGPALPLVMTTSRLASSRIMLDLLARSFLNEGQMRGYNHQQVFAVTEKVEMTTLEIAMVAEELQPGLGQKYEDGDLNCVTTGPFGTFLRKNPTIAPGSGILGTTQLHLILSNSKCAHPFEKHDPRVFRIDTNGDVLTPPEFRIDCLDFLRACAETAGVHNVSDKNLRMIRSMGVTMAIQYIADALNRTPNLPLRQNWPGTFADAFDSR